MLWGPQGPYLRCLFLSTFLSLLMFILCITSRILSCTYLVDAVGTSMSTPTFLSRSPTILCQTHVDLIFNNALLLKWFYRSMKRQIWAFLESGHCSALDMTPRTCGDQGSIAVLHGEGDLGLKNTNLSLLLILTFNFYPDTLSLTPGRQLTERFSGKWGMWLYVH